MTQLTALELVEPDRKVVRLLARFTSLKSLKIRKFPLNIKFLEFIAPLQNLVQLEIQGGHEVRKILVPKWTNLKFDLVSLKISGNFPENIFPNLQTFWITSFGRRTFDLNSDKYGIKSFLLKHPQLTSFRVFGVNSENYNLLVDESVEWIRKNCPQMREFFCMPCSMAQYEKAIDSEEDSDRGNMFVDFEKASKLGKKLCTEEFWDPFHEDEIWTDYDPDS
jgi:hypothetical protein